jgi:hypothetical protein
MYFTGVLLALLSAESEAATSSASAQKKVDVVIYGTTPAGIAAALSASRTAVNRTKKLTIALIEPTQLVGGMTSPGGIGMRDFGAEGPCCTIIEWANLNAKHYNVKGQVWQPDHFVGQASYRTLLSEAVGVELVLGQTLQEGSQSVVKSGTQISSITTVSTGGGSNDTMTTTEWVASYFIDASYEGDIVRFAGGISYTWGREAEAQYNEDLAGVLNPAPPFSSEVDATWPNGTLLKFVQPSSVIGKLGSADRGVMAFSYRACVTTNKTNMQPFQSVAPPGYNPDDFELMRRYLTQEKSPALFTHIFGVYPYRGYPSSKTRTLKHDLCDANTFPITSDAPDLQVGYINGSYADRARVYNNVKYYVQGYLHWLATDKGVPKATQDSVLEYGYCADEWPENNHFPPQMCECPVRSQPPSLLLTPLRRFAARELN